MKAIRNPSLFLLSALLLTSCSTQYYGIKPVSPGMYMPYEKESKWALLIKGGLIYEGLPDKPVPQVESLQPALKWEPAPRCESYDLVIYRGVPKDKPGQQMPRKEQPEARQSGWFVPGKEAYYREALRESSHRVQEPLAPDSVYVWSVRTRTGTNVSGWSTYGYRKGAKVLVPIEAVAGEEARGWWWPFRTPKQ